MADYHTAYVLSLIAGILILIGAILIGALGGFYASLSLAGAIPGALLLAIAVVGIIFGVLVIYGAMMINKKGKQQTGAIIVLIFSILSLIAGGGFIIGFVLGLVGAILAMTKK